MPLAVLLALAAPATLPLATRPVCRRATLEQAADHAPVGIHPLGAEPPATQVKAVLYSEHGCQTPIVVRDEVGMPNRR